MKETNNTAVTQVTFRLCEHMARIRHELYEELKLVSQMETLYPQIDWAAIYFDKGLQGLKEAFDLWTENFSNYISKEKKGV